MLRILRFLRPDAKKVVGVSFLILISTIANLALPTIMSAIVDRGINASDMGFIIKASALMFATAAVGLAALITAVKISAVASARFSGAIRTAVFKKVNSLPYKKFSEIGTGALLTRSTEDIWMIEEVAYFIMRGSVTIPVLVIGGTVLALMKNVWLALIMFSCTPILIVALIIVSRKIMPLWDTADKYIDKQNSIIRERLMGIRVIRAFNREDYERGRAAEATRIMAHNIIKNNVHMGLINPLSVLLLDLIVIAIVAVGAATMENPAGILSAGDIIAVVQYVTLVMTGIMSMSFAIALIPRVRVNTRRIFEVLDAESLPEAHDLNEPPLSGDIRFENVSFRYEGAAEAAASSLNFEIKKGEKVAFIGGTGAGKSTVVQLLLAFLRPTEGEIYFDNIPMTELSAARVRQNISCALQKTSIFEGTIKSNIKMSDESASDEEVEAAAADAGLGGYLAELEKGILHELQPGGTNVSGGQKQRIALARALLKKASVYVFDDTFSALDFMTELKIRKKLNERLKGKTQIYVTQRVASAMSCDQIFVLDKGAIIASGKHKELINSCPLYREIYVSQTGGEIK